MGFQTEPLEQKIDILESKLEKLKQLVLLTDPAVSGTIVGELQVIQWAEFIKEFPDEA